MLIWYFEHCVMLAHCCICHTDTIVPYEDIPWVSVVIVVCDINSCKISVEVLTNAPLVTMHPW